MINWRITILLGTNANKYLKQTKIANVCDIYKMRRSIEFSTLLKNEFK